MDVGVSLLVEHEWQLEECWKQLHDWRKCLMLWSREREREREREMSGIGVNLVK